MSNRSPVKTRNVSGSRRLFIDFHYLDEHGRRVRYRRDATVQRRAAAHAEAQRLMELAARTGSPFARPGTPTFGAFVDATYRPVYMPWLRKGTRLRYEGILRQGVLEAFGRLTLDQIDEQRVLAYAAELQKRPRERSYRGRTHGIDPRGHGNLIKAVLRAAVSAGVLPWMPRMPSFKESEKLPDAPTAEHVGAVLQSAPGWLRTAAALQALAGLRQGEVRALQVGDLDFAAGCIHVRRAFSEDEIVPPKGGKPRMVPMADELVPLLEIAVRGKLPKALVVTDEKGRAITRQGMLARLKALQRRAGLREWWCHALRHYFCSELARRGVSVEAIRSLAGHANLRTTQRYLHATDADLHAAIGKLRGN